jgi:hypothetical protein
MASAYPNRRAQIASDDPTVAISPAPPSPPSVGNILIRAGDIIDVGIDWSLWAKANDAKLKTSTFAAHGSTPAAPTIASQGADLDRGHGVAVIDASAAAVGAVYWLVNTAVFEDLTPDGTYSFPDRTLKRTIYVIVTA